MGSWFQTLGSCCDIRFVFVNTQWGVVAMVFRKSPVVLVVLHA